MKLNAKKITISSLAALMGAGFVGSISGTVAWFQYSTRSTVAFTGASAHCTENLQVRVGADGTWKSDLLTSDIKTYVEASEVSTGVTRGDSNLVPVTSGELSKDAVPSTFYKNPIYQYTDYTVWGEATKKDYIELPLEFRVLDVDGEAAETLLAKDVYLTDLTIKEKTVSGKSSIINALRVGIEGLGTMSIPGADVNVFGKLDLNNDSANDKTVGYDFDGELAEITYGDDGKKAESYAYNSTSIIADDSDPNNITGGKKIGTTTASGDMLKVNVKIWLEGWQELEGKALWEAAKYIGSQFNIGMRFTCVAHVAH